MSQQSPVSQPAVNSDIAMTRNIDVIDSKLAKLKSRLSSAALKQASPAIPENNQDIRRVLEHLEEPVIVHTGGTIAYVNAAASRQYGVASPRELIGVSFLSLIHPEHRTVVKVRMAALERWPDRDASAKIVGLAADGREHPASIRMSALGWRGGPAILSLYDRPSASAEEVDASSAVPIAMEDMTWEWWVETDAIHVGPGFQRLLNLTDTEAVKGLAGWNALVQQDDLPTLQHSIEKYIAGKDTHFEFDVRLISSEDEERWLRLSGRALRDGENTVDRLTGMAIDVSELKHAESELISHKHKQNKTRRILANRTAALAAREDELDQARRLVDASNAELAVREQELAEVKQGLQDTSSELAARRDELKESRRTTGEREATVASRDKELAQLREMLRSTTSDLGEKEQQLDKTTFLLEARTAELNARAGELARIKESLDDRDNELAKRSHELTERDDEISKLRAGLAKRDDAISSRDRDLAHLRETFQARTSALTTQGKELADAKALLEKTGATLETTGAALAEREHELEALREQHQETQSTLADRQADLHRTADALETHRSALTQREQELSETRQTLEDRETDLAERHTDLREARERLESHAEALAARDTEIARTAEVLAGQSNEITELKLELAVLTESLDARLAALRDQETELCKITERVSRRDTRIAEQEDELDALKRALGASSNELTAQTAAFAEAKQLLDSGGKQLSRQGAELSARNEELDQAKKQLDVQSGELERLRDRVDFSSHIQSQFLAGMSHELLTPLNAIKGFAEVISQEMFGGLGNDQYREYATDIVSSADHLRHMIGELLELSRITEQKAELREECLDVQSVMRDIQRRVAGRAEEAELALGLNISTDLPTLEADGLMVRQMLLNLVSNAIKFTDSGGMIEIAALSDADEGLAISVRDTGAGIPEDAIEAILAPFGQANGNVSRTHAGNGLGLTLARAQIEAHGGQLEIDSTLGKGTTVTLHFPPSRSTARSAGTGSGQPDVSVPVPQSVQTGAIPATRPKRNRKAVS